MNILFCIALVMLLGGFFGVCFSALIGLITQSEIATKGLTICAFVALTGGALLFISLGISAITGGLK